MTAALLIFLVTDVVIGIQRIPRLHIGRPAGATRHAVPPLDAHRLWLALAAFSTLAGNLTIIGSVVNIIFETARREGVEVSFFEYLRVGLPLTLLTLVLAWVWL